MSCATPSANLPWRLIEFDKHDGATNMAIDEALLQSVLSGESSPVLRFYNFDPRAISIGYAQRLPVRARQNAYAAGFDVVRRPSGGRAVLHADELTYSFVGTTLNNSFLSPSVSTAYKQICQGLINGFQNLGVYVELGQTHSSYRSAYKDQYDCFMATTGADLHYRGRKIAGSAQLRRHHAVLQHGSILLAQSQTSMAEILGESSTNIPVAAQNTKPSAPPLRHANLFEIVPAPISIEDLQKAFRRGFEQAFDCRFLPSQLTASEVESAKQLRAKYVVEPVMNENADMTKVFAHPRSPTAEPTSDPFSGKLSSN